MQQDMSPERLSSLPENIRSYLSFLEKQLENSSEIALALSREKDMSRLLEMILKEAKRISHADGGTLYMMTDENNLRFEIILTDSLKYHMGGTSGKDISFPPLRLFLENGAPNNSMVAAYVALSGNTVNIHDAYEAKGFDFTGTRAFDSKTGYRSKSFLTVPLRNHENDIIGVLQLLNALDPLRGEIIPFATEVQKTVEALASQAAVAITNKNLISDLSRLFESFIELIAAAIDAKSPYTGGHCERVPVLTMMLAEAVNKTPDGPLKDVFFSENELYELKIAAWLHDCGKVTTPEYVVDKSTKLETIYDRIHEVETRFEALIKEEEVHYLKEKIKILSDINIQDSEKKTRTKQLAKDFRGKASSLRKDLVFITQMNTGTEFMQDEFKSRVKMIAGKTWTRNGVRYPLLTENEVYNLCVTKGTLTDEERKTINDHIVQTIRMLEELPYPKHLKHVPEYAGGHHETLIGTGYPRGLKKDQLSVQSRIMAIADIFEALTASDRPYKKAKTLGESLRIMKFMGKDSHIDTDILEIFLKEKVYLKYASEHLDPSQIDID